MRWTGGVWLEDGDQRPAGAPEMRVDAADTVEFGMVVRHPFGVGDGIVVVRAALDGRVTLAIQEPRT